MPYPLRPANPAAVKAKNALFMRVLLGAEIATTKKENDPTGDALVDRSAFRTLRGQLCDFKRPRTRLVPLCASAREGISALGRDLGCTSPKRQRRPRGRR